MTTKKDVVDIVTRKQRSLFNCNTNQYIVIFTNILGAAT